jgi:hypothetical protein
MHLNHHHLQNKRDFDGMSTSSSRKEKRQYKKRKHKAQREVIKPSGKRSSFLCLPFSGYKFTITFISLLEPYDGMFSSDDEDLSTQLGASESEDEGIYPFRRNRNCNYYQVSIHESNQQQISDLQIQLAIYTKSVRSRN